MAGACVVAAACGSPAGTTSTTLEPAADAADDPGPAVDAADDPGLGVDPAGDPGPAVDAAGDPGLAAADTTTTFPVPVPVADRLPADPAAPAAEWVAGINTAGWGFHRHLEGNAVSSPISIGTAFSLARAGASPGSASVLDEIFGFPQAGLHSAANAVDLALTGAAAPSTLEIANRLFPDDDFTMRPEFVHTAATQYGSDIEPLDTANGAAGADIINRWVSGSTRGLVPTIVDAGVVQDQELILVNTVYLQADWLQHFSPRDTQDGPFIAGDDRSVMVPFMRDRKPVDRRFVRLPHADAVELPYQGGGLAMWLIVPHDPVGLAAVEESLDAAALTGLHHVAETGLVDLTMPKWEQTLPPTDLFAWLCPMGFCAGAPFDGIAPGILISAALHGAKVSVDERGTEAAATTALGFRTSGPLPPDLTIVADRPFLWAVIHQPTSAVVFLGRLVDPTA